MFAGIVSFGPEPAQWTTPERVFTALCPFNASAPRSFWQSPACHLFQINGRAGALQSTVFEHKASATAVVFWGRLDNRVDLLAHLQVGPNVSDQELVALAWLKWGEHCPEYLVGDFAFAVVCQKTGILFLARDVMGVKPLFYRVDANGVFFASSVAAFKTLNVGTITPSKHWMAAYLIDISHSHTETAYQEIKKLPGAHCVLIHANGRSQIRRYHNFVDDAPVERKRDAVWLEKYRHCWQEAIACRMPAQGSIACENSGGLDSGSITAELARQLGADVGRLHTMGFCYQADEPAHIMATAMKWGIKHNTLFSESNDPAWQQAIERALLVSGYPQEHINGVSHHAFYALCQAHGSGVLFSGFGGDEAVTYFGGMPARYELFDQRNWAALWRSFAGPLPMKAARMAKTIVMALQKMPENNSGMLEMWAQRWPWQFLRREILDAFNLEHEYYATATYDEKYRTINDAVRYLVSRPYAPIRLENCTLMAASYGIDYVWPLLDQRLVQQWLSTPAVWKVGNHGMNRFLHRKAVSGVSADLVAWKLSKDMGQQTANQSATVHDNTKMLSDFLELLENLKPELVELIDVERLQEMALKDKSEGKKGAEYSWTMSRNIEKLETLNLWNSQC